MSDYSDVTDLFCLRDYGETLVTIKRDGTIEYGDKYTPDDAAKVFWSAIQHHDRIAKLLSEIDFVRAENKKLREELAEYKRNGIVDVTGSMNYHSGYDDGAREERQRCARIAEQARDDTCDGPVAWSMADVIAASIRESGDE